MDGKAQATPRVVDERETAAKKWMREAIGEELDSRAAKRKAERKAGREPSILRDIFGEEAP
jgi:hypothetical protein